MSSINIKGLYFIWDGSLETPYLEAISLNENKLIEMIPLLKNKIKSTDSDGEIIIKDVDIYIAQKINNILKINKTVIIPSDFFLTGKLYAMNLDKQNIIDQVVLIVLDDNHVNSNEHKEFVKSIENTDLSEYKILEISNNPLELDLLYDEGTINA
jgi:hypothetical protein